jgi:hypothetical protein
VIRKLCAPALVQKESETRSLLHTEHLETFRHPPAHLRDQFLAAALAWGVRIGVVLLCPGNDEFQMHGHGRGNGWRVVARGACSLRGFGLESWWL